MQQYLQDIFYPRSVTQPCLFQLSAGLHPAVLQLGLPFHSDNLEGPSTSPAHTTKKREDYCFTGYIGW